MVTRGCVDILGVQECNVDAGADTATNPSAGARARYRLQVSERESYLRRFHAARPGVTAHAFARGGSYARLAAIVPADARALDLACGDGALLARIGPGALGLDASPEELAHASDGARVVRGRAQMLPFADQAFDIVVCHLAFMLFEQPELVVAEIGRVLRPTGRFVALLGGGPTAEGDDAFHRFLGLLATRGPRPIPRLTEPRARTEAGWRALFAGWEVAPFERWELDLGGSFDEVWRFLGASYEVEAAEAPALRAQLRAATADLLAGGRVPCRVVTWLATAIRR